MTDPIVEEARKAGQAYIESFKGDRKALLEDLRHREEAEGRRVVSRPPRKPKRRTQRKSDWRSSR